MARKRKYLTGRIGFVFLVLLFTACNYKKYVVVSEIAVMDMKEGKTYYCELDSTYEIYDHVRLKESDLKKSKFISKQLME